MPPSPVDQAGVQNALRKKYASKKIAEQVVFNQRCDNLLKFMQTKEVNMNGGAGFVLQMFARGSAQGPNRKFASAGQGKPVFRQLTMATKDIEERFSFTRNAMQDAMDAGGSNGGFNLAKLHIDQSLRLVKQNIGQLLESDGFGTLAFVSSVTGTTVIHLGDAAATPNKSRVNRFYLGQILCFAAAALTGELRSSGASDATVYTHTITAIDKSAGTITVNGNLSTSGVVAGDAISTRGYRAFDASASGATTFYGLDAWAPTTAIGSGDPLGRNGMPDLQPFIHDVTGASIIDAIIDTDQKAFDLGIPVGSKMLVPSHVVKSLSQGAMKGQVVQMQTTRSGSKGDYTLGYSGFKFQGMQGEVEIVPSAHTTVARWFDPEIFRLAYVGEDIVNVHKGTDGNMYRLVTDGVTDSASEVQSGYSGEIYSRLQLLCDRPGDIIVLKGLKED